MEAETVTYEKLNQWQAELKWDKTKKPIIIMTRAFNACMRHVASEEDLKPLYKVEDPAVFNGVIQLCVLELGPALRRFLGLSENSKQPPHKCKKFTKIKNTLKGYFVDLLKLLTNVQSPNIQIVLLKHLHYMSNLLVSFPNITKSLVKKLITIWGTAEDTVKITAFFCILRITNNNRALLLDTVLKSMYLTYVKNSKFVSIKSLASINFMRRSLVEMFALDINVAYEHVFLYIRQLAIHLRNANMVKKKENIQAVYNWQFLNSLRLWGSLLSVTCNKPQMQQLVYPLVQVCLGTIRLVPTAQYYPLRFHVVQILIDLSKDTGVFVPVLPFLLEVLNGPDINKEHVHMKHMKQLQFSCLFRLPKSQLSEKGFKDAVIETVYSQLLEYLSSQSHTIGFPDLSIICTMQLKQFVKKCSNANYNRKIKQVIDKIEQTNQFIENERKKLTVNLSDIKQIEGWESQIKSKGTPLTIFYENWNKVHTIKKNEQLTGNEELADYKFPQLKKPKSDAKKSDEGPVVLFPSDSEDDEVSFGMEQESQKKRRKRGGKKVQKKFKSSDEDKSVNSEEAGPEDEVEDLKISDW